MSIAHNVGGVAHHLSKLRTRPGYFGIKRVYRSVTNKIPGGKFLYQLTHRMKTWMKNRLLDTTLFEDMGFTYIGPVDGHDLKRMIYLLRVARAFNARWCSMSSPKKERATDRQRAPQPVPRCRGPLTRPQEPCGAPRR